MTRTILFLVDTLVQLAGSERNIYELTTRMDPAEFRPVVMCMRGGPLVGALRTRGIEVIDLRLAKIYGPHGLAVGARLYRFIKRRPVSLLVTYHDSSDFLGAVVGRLAGVPVVMSSRRDMGYMLEARHILAYRFINRLFDRIITVSDAVRASIAAREKVPFHKLVTLHNGVDAARFCSAARGGEVRRELGIPEDAPVIGILAALRPVKGHVYFLEAAAEVARRYPEARFLVAGWSTSAEYTASLRRLAAQLGIAGRVIFTGGRPDTPDILDLITVPVFSSFNEGFSNAVIEAMAAGKPVIATDSGGTAEAVISGVTGFLVPPRDFRALAAAVIRLLDHPEEARSMGLKGRGRVEQYFSMERMTRRFLDLCRDMLAARGTERGPRPSVAGSARRLAKQALSAGMYYSGHLNRPARQGIGILAYHRVTDDPFMIPGMSVKVENFERQMRFIKKRYHPVSLEAAVQALERGEPLPPGSLVITFDDGYRDNYTNAFPVLKAYGIPATIFLSVQAIEEGSLLWFDRVIESLRLTAAGSLDLRDRRLGKFSLRTSGERLAAASAVIEHAKKLAPPARGRFLDMLQKRLSVKPALLAASSLMMRWDEVVEMGGPFISFGSHGMSHSIMSGLSASELRFEIQRSREIIRFRTGVAPRLFAYPNGGGTDFDSGVEQVLREHDYAGACTLIKGLNDSAVNRLALRRVCVSQGMESGVTGRFSPALFAFSLSRSFMKGNAALPAPKTCGKGETACEHVLE